MPLDKLAFSAKPEIKLELKLEHGSIWQITLQLELSSFRSNSSN